LRVRIVAGAALAAALLSLSTSSFSCAGGDDTPAFDLAKRRYDNTGNGAWLSPANDTRANLLLLLADERAAIIRPPATREIFYSWKEVRGRAGAAPVAVPPFDGTEDPLSGTRCQTNASGQADFAAALAANRRLAPAERAALTAARAALRPGCTSDTAQLPAPAAAVRSATAGAFATYLDGAHAFYAADYERADRDFASLATAPDPWLRETARYMVARTRLNAAQDALFDEYGYMVEAAKRDHAKAAAADAALRGYLAAFPAGRYASSARGLLRRTAWFAGNDAALARDYAAMLAKPAEPVRIIEEIDAKLLTHDKGYQAATGPLLLAVADLQRLRSTVSEEQPYPGWGLTRAELERQRPQFAGRDDLYTFLLAAEALYNRSAAAEVLRLIPDAAHQPRFTTLQFSRQLLRGLALDLAGDRKAYAFWLSLLPGATGANQRGAVELAIAQHEEKRGSLDRLLADASPVQTPALRRIALAHLAGPDLLRARAAAPRAADDERELAAYVLLTRELGRGRYADFLRDEALIPPARPRPTPEETYPQPLDREQEELEENAVYSGDLAIFRTPRPQPGLACPDLRATATRLAAAPTDPHARLCLADWFRLSDLDYYPFDQPLAETGFGSTPSRFPGQPYSRLAVYQSLLANPRLTPDDRAYTLYRAVWCFGPSGINSCGGAAPKPQRRAWFSELKTRYPQSRWARSLPYYW